jgi:hypothetical protein
LIYRWLYKLWKYFWITVGTLLGLAVLIIVLGGIILQLPQTKEYVRSEIVTTFNQQFEGTLDIEEVRGFLPFTMEVVRGSIHAPDDSTNVLISFDRANITVNWWELLQQNLSISSFEVDHPNIYLTKHNGDLNFNKAFKQRPAERRTTPSDSGTPQIFNEINILAPYLSISNGEITLDESIQLPEQLNIPSPLNVREVNTTLYFEFTDSQLFADIIDLSVELPGTEYGYLRGYGQFYSDNQYFELNRIQLSTDLGGLEFSLEANPVNLLEGDVITQFREAEYRADLRNGSISSTFLQRFFPVFPDFRENLELELALEGTFEELFLDRFQVSIGQTSAIVNAVARNLLNDQLSYDLQIDNLVLHPEEMQYLSGLYLGDIDLERYQLSTLRGDINGNLQTVSSDMVLRTGSGNVSFDAFINFQNQFEYEFLAEIDSLDISPVLKDTVNTTMLDGRVVAKGVGLNRDGNFEASFDLGKSKISGYDVESFIGEFSMNSDRFNYSIYAEDDIATVRSRGFYSENNSVRQLSTEGSVSNLNLSRYSTILDADTTSFTGTYSANIQGTGLEDLFGRISIEMEPALINSDTLRAHQLYADLDSNENDSRTLRFTSSFLDGEISGTISPETITSLGSYWAEYLQNRISEEILFDEGFEFTEGISSYEIENDANLNLSLSIVLKDLELLKKYIPQLPLIQSRARLTASVNADSDRMLLSGNLFDEAFSFENLGMQNLNSSFSANFRYGSTLSEYSRLNFQLNSSESAYNDQIFKESFINMSMRNDSLEIKQSLTRDDDINLSTSLFAVISPGQFEILVDEFVLGSPNYKWITEGKPLIKYTEYNALTFENFLLSSDEDLVEINGTFSSSIEDSVDFTVKNFDISRISDLIGGRITFSGIMNGEFVTRTLREAPSIQGFIAVDQGRIDGRLIGDVTLNSEFNSAENQFDTEVRVYTDPEKYSNYLNNNNGVGHDLRFNGYFKLPDDADPDQELFYFDADLREIDMWIVTFIVPAIVEEMEGNSSGTGYIKGTRNDFDFDATFQISDVYAVPLFLNTGFTLNGELGFSKTDWLQFKNIELTDSEGGTGLLYGEIDLDDFSPDNFLDLTLDLNNLHILNNPYDPDVPFYASIYGTGQARITGSNFSPFLRTTTPIVISSNSQVSIPLEEETEFEQDRRFIQFVDSFDLSLLGRRAETDAESRSNGDTPPEELTFIERFTMDLQFAANNPVNVQLVFDRVTNEILNANGTGQVRILLEDQDVSMFGRFNIQGGDYQFVSGDIFTRRFILQEGGSISWQGDLVDASLNVTAAYRARPTISSLLSTSSTSAPVTESGQRIPVDLVLQIGGTISAVENDFFFRVPTGIEGTLDPTISTQINNLNQNEQDKLYQATAILLSGNFLPSPDAQGLAFGEGLTGTATVVNPLITSQVINPLLSNQINSLLRSDITFDIDLNLTAFNEVDLGVALRLFDDRVILRRDGQITGEQSDIGDIGATYRINRTFSLTAFHRQDPTLSYTSGVETRQTQEMNGMGLEAQVQFNTWKSFRNRISNAFRSFFGIQRKDEEADTDTAIAEN